MWIILNRTVGSFLPQFTEGKKVLGVSGVTIGTGVDLGQQTRGSLRTMGVPPFLLEKLLPYIGLQRTAALQQLCAIPLTISPEEVVALDTAVKSAYINEAARLFGQKVFENAPPQAQAVAVSLHYQFGTPFRKASPNLNNAWGAMQNGDYSAAAQFLRDSSGWSKEHQIFIGTMAKPGRRMQEAALLEGLV